MTVGSEPNLARRVEAAPRFARMHQFEGEDHAGLAQLADTGMLGNRCRQPGHELCRRPVARDDILVLEDRQRFQSGRTAQRVAAVAVRVQEGAFAAVVEEGLVHVIRGQHRSQRQETAGQAFRQADEVRGNAGLLAGEQTAGATEADRDLVGDQVYAVLVAELPRASQVVGMVHAHAAGALHQGFQDQRADLLAVAFEDRRQLIGATSRHVLRRLAGLGVPGIWRRREDRFQQQRRVGAAIQRDVGHRQRAQCFAVVAVGQRHEARALLVATIAMAVEAHLERDLHSRRTVLGVEHTIKPFRRDLHQLLSEANRRFMAESGEDHMLQFARLPRDGIGDARIGVTEQIGPPAGHGIQIASTVVVDQPGPFAACDGNQRQRVRVLAHLRAGMPQHGEVALSPVFGVVSGVGHGMQAA